MLEKTFIHSIGSALGGRTRERVDGALPGARLLRVALLTNEIPPYRVPLYSCLAQTTGWEFRVFTNVQREIGRHWDIGHTLPFSVERSRSFSYVRSIDHEGHGAAFLDRRQVHVPVGLVTDLWRYRPDVVISVEMGARTLIADGYAGVVDAKLLVYFEGTPHTERHTSWQQDILRKILCRPGSRFLCNGREGRRYLEGLGAKRERIVEIGQAIDLESFSGELSEDERTRLQARLGVSGLCYLYVGSLIPLKGLHRLLDAWQRFCRLGPGRATLVLAGEGTERADLQDRVIREGIPGVMFLGFLQRRELAAVYQAADVFVFPSLQDCWALAVEEAMASGLPVIDSKYNGGAELIRENENGWIADPNDVTDLFDKLELAWRCRERLKAMGEAARAAVSPMSVEAVAERIRGGIAQATLNR